MFKVSEEVSQSLKKAIDLVFQEMVKKGVAKVTINYAGGNDEGWADEVLALDSKGEPVPMSLELPHQVYELVDTHVICGWENNEGGEGTITFTLPDTCVLSHGINEIQVQTSDYQWDGKDFKSKSSFPSVLSEGSPFFTEKVQPILDLISKLQEGGNNVVGIIANVYGEVDSGLIHSIGVIEQYDSNTALSTSFDEWGSVELAGVRIGDTSADMFIADVSTLIAETCFGSLDDTDDAYIYYYNHPSCSSKIKCEVSTLVRKTHNYEM